MMTQDSPSVSAWELPEMLARSLGGEETLIFYIMQTHFKGNDSLSQFLRALGNQTHTPLRRQTQTKALPGTSQIKNASSFIWDFYFFKSI